MASEALRPQSTLLCSPLFFKVAEDGSKNPAPAAHQAHQDLVSGVLHVDLLKDAQLADAKGNAAQEGQNVGLSWAQLAKATGETRIHLGSRV